MMQASAEVVPSLWVVRLSAAGATGAVVWTRQDGREHVTIGQGAILVDRAPTLNRAYTYIATDLGTGASVVCPPVTVDSGYPVISSTMYATAYQVTVLSQRLAGRGRSVYHPTLEASPPLTSIFKADSPNGVLDLDCPDAATVRSLIAMLMPGDNLLLRSCCEDRVIDMTILMIDWALALKDDTRKGGPWTLSIMFQSVTDVPPLWTPPPDRTYQTVLDTHPTYQDIVDTFPTYQALLDGVPG